MPTVATDRNSAAHAICCDASQCGPSRNQRPIANDEKRNVPLGGDMPFQFEIVQTIRINVGRRPRLPAASNHIVPEHRYRPYLRDASQCVATDGSCVRTAWLPASTVIPNSAPSGSCRIVMVPELQSGPTETNQ